MSTNSDRLRRITYKSPYGPGVLVWRGELLIAHGLPGSKVADNLFSSFTLITSKHESSSARISSAGLDSDIPRTTAEKKLVRQLENYFAGKKTAFDLRKIPIDRTGWKLFQSRVADALAAVRYGTTISYAELAMVAGHPRASRAVGNCMAANPYPVIIPCHRVVRSDGSLGKFSAGRGWKARLLSLEGLPFSE